MNVFDQMREAMKEARQRIASADVVANDIAWMLKGRLRHVSDEALIALKRELSQFNSKTKRWTT
jgi:hypothetical protein